MALRECLHDCILFCGCCKHGHPASSVNKLDQSCEATGFSAFCNGFVHIICDAEADFIFVLQLKKFCLNSVFIGCFIFLLLFTCLNFFYYFPVWQKLEEENQDFFKAYYLRLMLKHQIVEFNELLEQQVQLMRQIHPTSVSSIPTSNGSHIPPCKTAFT